MMKDIVCISGALTTARLWASQEQFFHNKYRFHHVNILACDSIYDMALRIADLALPSFILMGFSLGGYVALEATQLMSEKIEKLILINTAANKLPPKAAVERKRVLDLIQEDKFEYLVNLMFQNSFFNAEKYHQIFPFLRDMAYQVGVDHYKKQLSAMLHKPDHTVLLPSIMCPTLCIASEHDRVVPAQRSDVLAQVIPNAELVYIERAGHLVTLEQPEAINKILQHWLPSSWER